MRAKRSVASIRAYLKRVLNKFRVAKYFLIAPYSLRMTLPTRCFLLRQQALDTFLPRANNRMKGYVRKVIKGANTKIWKNATK